jgi:transposase
MDPRHGSCDKTCEGEEEVMAKTLQEGDIVILDNLPAHKSRAAEQAIRERGAWLLFLPL